MQRSKFSSRTAALLLSVVVTLTACGTATNESADSSRETPAVADNEFANTASEPATSTEASQSASGNDASSSGDDSDTTINDGAATSSNSALADTLLPSSVTSLSHQTIDGQTFELANLAGQDVVLWFWAPW